MNEPVKITEKAREEILDIMKNKNIPEDYGLRIGVKGGGCGVSLILGFDRVKPTDERFIIEDIPVYIQKKEMMFVIGKEVDFYEGAEKRGFFFN